MSIIPLAVPYADKDWAKSLGARWDPLNRYWYIQDDMDITLFAKWLAKDHQLLQDATARDEATWQGVSLTEYLSHIAKAVQKVANTSVWIRAEIMAIKEDNKGNYRLELVDSSSLGRQMAKCQAIIWRDKKEPINQLFKQQTDSKLQVGMKILMQGYGNFHVLHGFSITIMAIDPSYTLGNLQANLQALRKRLKLEKIYGNNKLVARPSDFTHVAVISPANAAGLGDFKKEADLLESYDLCHFSYYHALFQGKEAPLQLAQQIFVFLEDHLNEHYDVLVIIRGGGAVTDLAWLNDYAIATAICKSPVAVFSGIGHAKDNTIIDEVANLHFDTPSKVIKYISQQIVDHAKTAQKNIDTLITHATTTILMEKTAIKTLLTTTIKAIDYQVASQRQGLQQYQLNILYRFDHVINQLSEYLRANIGKIVVSCDHAIAIKRHNLNMVNCILVTKLSTAISLVGDYQAILNDHIIGQLSAIVGHYTNQLSGFLVAIVDNTRTLLVAFNDKLEHNHCIIELANPLKILKRGFVLVRSPSHGILSSKLKALQALKLGESLTLAFFDGNLVIDDGKKN